MAIRKPIGRAKREPLPLSFTTIDFETTGFSPFNDRIIEVGAVKVRNDEIVGTINFMVLPKDFISGDMEIREEVTKITGHTWADVILGIPEETAVELLTQFIGEDLIVSHNAIFDLGMLENAIDRLWGGSNEEPPNDCLCTLTIGREHYPYPHKLGDMCRRFNIPLDPHGALNDAMATAQLLIAMNQEHDVIQYVNILGYKRQYGEPEYVPQGKTLKGQGSVTINHSEGAGK